MERKDELTILGKKTEYKQDYAPEVLESFVNKHPGNDYWVRFNCPEFTSLCHADVQGKLPQIPPPHHYTHARAQKMQFRTAPKTPA